MAKKKTVKSASPKKNPQQINKNSKKPRSQPRSFPKNTVEEATKIALVIKEKGDNNTLPPSDIAKALDVSHTTTNFYYLVASAKAYGITEGSRDSKEISLTELGKAIVYPLNHSEETLKKQEAFTNIPLFKNVLDHFHNKGQELPEMSFLGNTLIREFQLDQSEHEEFTNIFRKNCQDLNITSNGTNPSNQSKNNNISAITTVAESSSGLKAFVIMPFIAVLSKLVLDKTGKVVQIMDWIAFSHKQRNGLYAN